MAGQGLALGLAMALTLAPGMGLAHSDRAILANPWGPHTEFAVTTAGGDFVLVVAPNLVEYAEARAAAVAESARFCQSLGKTAPAEFGHISRYSDTVLDGWEFAGRCE